VHGWLSDSQTHTLVRLPYLVAGGETERERQREVRERESTLDFWALVLRYCDFHSPEIRKASMIPSPNKGGDWPRGGKNPSHLGFGAWIERAESHPSSFLQQSPVPSPGKWCFLSHQPPPPPGWLWLGSVPWMWHYLVKGLKFGARDTHGFKFWLCGFLVDLTLT
jgi:hypothetical protein